MALGRRSLPIKHLQTSVRAPGLVSGQQRSQAQPDDHLHRPVPAQPNLSAQGRRVNPTCHLPWPGQASRQSPAFPVRPYRRGRGADARPLVISGAGQHPSRLSRSIPQRCTEGWPTMADPSFPRTGTGKDRPPGLAVVSRSAFAHVKAMCSRPRLQTLVGVNGNPGSFPWAERYGPIGSGLGPLQVARLVAQGTARVCPRRTGKTCQRTNGLLAHPVSSQGAEIEGAPPSRLVCGLFTGAALPCKLATLCPAFRSGVQRHHFIHVAVHPPAPEKATARHG